MSSIGAILRYALPAIIMFMPDANAQETDHVSPFEMVEWQPATIADHRIRYDDAPYAFGDLRLPAQAADGDVPVVVVIHGGAWRAEWGLDYMTPLAEGITETGFATWHIEFRRLGHRGGGWVGTFEDVGRAVDYLRTLARDFPLDLDRVITLGHSSGGHLALWVAGRHRIPSSSPLYVASPLPIAGTISLAGIPDLEGALDQGGRDDVLELLGYPGDERAARFAAASPQRLLPLGVAHRHVIGSMDNPWRLGTTEAFVEAARAAGDDVGMEVVGDTNHFDVVAANGMAWALVVEALSSLAYTDKPDP